MPTDPAERLTSRELEVALLAAQGMKSADIAALLFVSVRTVHTHLRNAYAKTGAGNRVQLLNWLTDHAPGPEAGP